MKANLRLAWPSLLERPVAVGGTEVPYAEALRAYDVLAASRTSAIMPVLRAVRCPLAECDYFAAAAPYRERTLYAPRTGRRGAAGRHVTKIAFMDAIEAALEAAREDDLAAAIEAFSRDERYAAAMAAEACQVRERARASGVRSSVRAAVLRALSACGAQEGLFTCDEATACGTGACRFAAPALRLASAPAGPGKFTRPANHVRAGSTFSEAAQAAEVLAAKGRLDGVDVFDDDAVATGGWAA